MSGAVDIPVLQHSASTRVAQDRSCIGVPSGYLPAMHLLLCAHRSHGLLENLIAVAITRAVSDRVGEGGRAEIVSHVECKAC